VKKVARKLWQALAWLVGMPLLLLAVLIVPVVVIGLGSILVDEMQGGERTRLERSKKDLQRHRAFIAKRGGYVIMQVGTTIFHLPANDKICAFGRDRRNYSFNLGLPGLTLMREPCGPPYVREDRALVFLSETDGTGWPPVSYRAKQPARTVRAGEQHFESCTIPEAQADKTGRCGSLFGMSKGGLYYYGTCPRGLFCNLKTRVRGLEANIHVYPTSSMARFGLLVDQLDRMILAAAVPRARADSKRVAP
jgi:hypothetical protein